MILIELKNYHEKTVTASNKEIDTVYIAKGRTSQYFSPNEFAEYFYKTIYNFEGRILFTNPIKTNELTTSSHPEYIVNTFFPDSYWDDTFYEFQIKIDLTEYNEVFWLEVENWEHYRESYLAVGDNGYILFHRNIGG
jgi:hypothetical protein